MSKSTDNSQFSIVNHGTISNIGVMWYEYDESTSDYDYVEHTFMFRGVRVRGVVHLGDDIDRYQTPGSHHSWCTYHPVLQGPSPS